MSTDTVHMAHIEKGFREKESVHHHRTGSVEEHIDQAESREKHTENTVEASESGDAHMDMDNAADSEKVGVTRREPNYIAFVYLCICLVVGLIIYYTTLKLTPPDAKDIPNTRMCYNVNHSDNLSNTLLWFLNGEMPITARLQPDAPVTTIFETDALRENDIFQAILRLALFVVWAFVLYYAVFQFRRLLNTPLIIMFLWGLDLLVLYILYAAISPIFFIHLAAGILVPFFSSVLAAMFANPLFIQIMAYYLVFAGARNFFRTALEWAVPADVRRTIEQFYNSAMEWVGQSTDRKNYDEWTTGEKITWHITQGLSPDSRQLLYLDFWSVMLHLVLRLYQLFFGIDGWPIGMKRSWPFIYIIDQVGTDSEREQFRKDLEMDKRERHGHVGSELIPMNSQIMWYQMTTNVGLMCYSAAILMYMANLVSNKVARS